jgi:tripartite-type tricarboxylate transporter receptor subunit TctC
MLKRLLVAAAAGAALSVVFGGASGNVWAADYPAKPIRLVIGQPPGGPTDIAARVYAEKMRGLLGQAFIVENKPGAASQLSLKYVVTQEPDGYTLVYGGLGFAVLPYTSKSWDIDSIRDTTPISIIVSLPAGIAASTSMKVNNLDEFMADIRANPGKRNYGNAGATDNLVMQIFRKTADLPFETVRFNGLSPVLQAMYAGDVQFTYTTIGALKPLADQGKVKILVVSGTKRSPLAPDVPAMGELKDASLRGLVSNGWSPGWFGIVGPAKVPADAVNKLYAAGVKVVADPDFVKRMAEIGLEPVGSTPAEFSQRLKDDMAMWQRVTKQMNFQPE